MAHTCGRCRKVEVPTERTCCEACRAYARNKNRKKRAAALAARGGVAANWRLRTAHTLYSTALEVSGQGELLRDTRDWSPQVPTKERT